MTRFQLLNGPRRFPNREVVTGDTRQDNPVFDLGIELENFDGAVYIQVDHIQEMARSIGMLSKEQADELREENRRLKAQVEALPEKAQALTDGMARLVDNFRSDLNNSGAGLPTVEDNSNSESDEPEPIKSESELLEAELRELDQSAETIESSDEPSGVERPASVRESGNNKSTSLFE